MTQPTLEPPSSSDLCNSDPALPVATRDPLTIPRVGERERMEKVLLPGHMSHPTSYLVAEYRGGPPGRKERCPLWSTLGGAVLGGSQAPADGLI